MLTFNCLLYCQQKQDSNCSKPLPFGHLTKVMVLPVAIYLLTDTKTTHSCCCQVLKVTVLILVNESHHSLPIQWPAGC